MGLLSLLVLIVLILLALWIVGLVISWGTWVWAFLVVAIIVLLAGLFSGRRVWR